MSGIRMSVTSTSGRSRSSAWKNCRPESNARGIMCACFSACSSTQRTDSSSSTTQTLKPGVAISPVPPNGPNDRWSP